MKKVLSFFTRRRLFVLLTVAVLIAALALNLGLTGVMRRGGFYLDTTYEDLYTLSDAMVEACAEVLDTDDAPLVRAIFCSESDVLTKTATLRVPYFMALQMAKRFDCFEVDTLSVSENPTAVAAYKTTSRTEISSYHMILEAVYPDGHSVYRVVPLKGFWVTDADTGSVYSYNGEYRMASLLYSLLAVDKPTAYFITDHGAVYYDAENPESEGSLATGELYDLLRECGLSVGTLSAETEEIPEDCVLLILNDPKEDFDFDKDRATDLSYRTALEKIDRYLIERQGALMVARDYAATELTGLDAYLREWGFAFENALVRDEEESLEDTENTGTILIAQYDDGEDSYGQAIYGEITTYTSAARTVISNSGAIRCSFRNTDGLIYESGAQNVSYVFAPLFTSSSSAGVYKNGGDGYTELYAEGETVLCATSARVETNAYDNNSTKSYVFCAASADFFSNKLLGETSFANRDVVALLVRDVAGRTVFASGELGGTSVNYANAYGKVLYTPALYEEDSIVLDNGTVATVSELSGESSSFDISAYSGAELKRALTNGKRTAIVLAGTLAPLGLLIAGAVILIKRKYR